MKRNSFYPSKPPKARRLQDFFRETTVYWLFNREGILLYIGRASNVRLRIRQHEATTPWWYEVSHVGIDVFEDPDMARGTELAAIKEWAPKYNKASNRNNLNGEKLTLYEANKRKNLFKAAVGK